MTPTTLKQATAKPDRRAFDMLTDAVERDQRGEAPLTEMEAVTCYTVASTTYKVYIAWDKAFPSGPWWCDTWEDAPMQVREVFALLVSAVMDDASDQVPMTQHWHKAVTAASSGYDWSPPHLTSDDLDFLGSIIRATLVRMEWYGMVPR